MSDEIDDLLALVEKSMKGVVCRGTDKRVSMTRMSTGVPSLDGILGGGYVRGRFHEIAGDYSTGKTFLAQMATMTCQKEGGKVIWIDLERRYDETWFSKTGVDVAKLGVLRPNYGEEAIDAILKLLNQADLIVIDSLAALLPLAADEGSMEDKLIGTQAKMVSEGLRKIISHNQSTVVLATNQVRVDIGNRFNHGLMQKLIGGDAQTYYAAVIIQLTRKGWLKERIDAKTERRVGFIMECFLKKSNFAPPYTSCEVPFNFYHGKIDTVAALVDNAIDRELIKQSGPWYHYGKEKFMGKVNLCNYFTENQDKLEELQENIKL